MIWQNVSLYPVVDKWADYSRETIDQLIMEGERYPLKAEPGIMLNPDESSTAAYTDFSFIVFLLYFLKVVSSKGAVTNIWSFFQFYWQILYTIQSFSLH